MSRTRRAVGLTRSLLVYHAIPGRQRRLRRLYSQFVAPGDLVFDLGARVGNRFAGPSHEALDLLLRRPQSFPGREARRQSR